MILIEILVKRENGDIIHKAILNWRYGPTKYIFDLPITDEHNKGIVLDGYRLEPLVREVKS